MTRPRKYSKARSTHNENSVLCMIDPADTIENSQAMGEEAKEMGSKREEV